jgi:hypothetical protein
MGPPQPHAPRRARLAPRPGPRWSAPWALPSPTRHAEFAFLHSSIRPTLRRPLRATSVLPPCAPWFPDVTPLHPPAPLPTTTARRSARAPAPGRSPPRHLTKGPRRPRTWQPAHTKSARTRRTSPPPAPTASSQRECHTPARPTARPRAGAWCAPRARRSRTTWTTPRHPSARAAPPSTYPQAPGRRLLTNPRRSVAGRLGPRRFAPRRSPARWYPSRPPPHNPRRRCPPPPARPARPRRPPRSAR